MSLTVGVLSVQGDVAENIRAARQALADLGIDGTVVSVNTTQAISEVDVMIIPGGESTTIGRLSLAGDMLASLAARIRSGLPTLGICAGLILLSSTVMDRQLGKTDQPLLGVLDIRLERNSFGRQRDSFEATLSMEPIGIPEFKGVFIRAPSISTVGPDVEAVAAIDGRIVAVKKQNIIGTSFHPELAGDTAIHRYLVDMARR